jgi:hypothetical protein
MKFSFESILGFRCAYCRRKRKRGELVPTPKPKCPRCGGTGEYEDRPVGGRGASYFDIGIPWDGPIVSCECRELLCPECVSDWRNSLS